jgi:hypothetical protein
MNSTPPSTHSTSSALERPVTQRQEQQPR